MAEAEKVFPKPVDWDELYPGRFLKAGEFKGKKPTLTITEVDIQELVGDKGKQIKGVISFAKTEKKLALNKTNGFCLRAMFGRKVQDWVGKRVTLFAGVWDGDECIRVWGSPDIAAEGIAEIALPRKKPFKMTMHKVELGGPKAVPNAKPAAAPAIDLQAQIKRLHEAASIEDLDAAWAAVCEECTAAGGEVPLELEAACNERREALDVPY
jgi:hypothetical protein